MTDDLTAFVLARLAEDETRFNAGELPYLDEAERRGRIRIMYTADGEQHIASEQQNAELIAPDFVRAVAEGREPAVPGWSVLPAMRVLHRVQEDWDTRHGKQVLPGRPVT